MAELIRKKIEVFRAGNYGEDRIYTKDDVQAMADNYDPEFQKAPAVLGHPWEYDAPAYGWVLSLSRKGKSLWADMELLPELVDLIKSKKYEKRSIRVARNFQDKDIYVLHVGFLGAQLSAVPGMEAMEFSLSKDVDSELIEFDDFGIEDLDSKNKTEVPDMGTFTQEQFDSLMASKMAELKQEFSEEKKTAIQELTTEVDKLNKEVKDFNDEIEKKNTEIDTLKKEKVEVEVKNFVTGLVSEGKVLAKDTDDMTASLKEALEVGKESYNRLTKIFSERESVVEFGEDKDGKKIPVKAVTKDEKDKKDFAKDNDIPEEDMKYDVNQMDL